MIRRPPRSTQSRSSAASDVYKRQISAALRSSGTPAAASIAQVAGPFRRRAPRGRLAHSAGDRPPAPAGSSGSGATHEDRPPQQRVPKGAERPEGSTVDPASPALFQRPACARLSRSGLLLRLGFLSLSLALLP